MSLASWLKSFFHSAPPPVDKSADPAEAKSASPGEKVLVNLVGFGGPGGRYATWTAYRAELVQHYKGWSYIAIKAIAEEIAGLCPMIAYVRPANEVAKEKSRIKSLANAADRLEELAALKTRYVSKARKLKSLDYRIKSLATVQNADELEPVPFDHPLAKLFHTPNTIDTAWTFTFKIALYLELTGSCYLWTVRNKLGDPVEMWVIPSQWVRPVVGREELIEEYEIRPMAGYIATEWGGGWFPGGSGMMTLPPEDVIAIHYPHPINFLDGMSPLTAVGEWIDVSESIDKSRVAHFQNGMFPGVAVEIDPSVADPKPDTVERFKAEIMARYVGVRRNKEPIVLGAGIKLVPLSNTPAEMDYTSSGDQLKSWVLAAHRVGQSIVGLAEETNFASMVAARANFHTSTIRPKLILLGQSFTRWLAKPMDESLIVYWEDSLPEDPEFKLRQEAQDLQTGVRTINEIRVERGLEPYPQGGDDPMLPMTTSPIPWVTGEEPEDAPLPALAALDQANKQEQADAKQQTAGAQQQTADARQEVAGMDPEADNDGETEEDQPEETNDDKFARSRADLLRGMSTMGKSRMHGVNGAAKHLLKP